MAPLVLSKWKKKGEREARPLHLLLPRKRSCFTEINAPTEAKFEVLSCRGIFLWVGAKDSRLVVPLMSVAVPLPVFSELPILYDPKLWIRIYPSQRHNLPPTLEIITRIFQKFPKKSRIFENFKISKKNWKLLTFPQKFPKLREYNIKHNLARSCFQLWPL